MEGTNGVISFDSENNAIKTIKRKHMGMNAQLQFKLQKLAENIVKNTKLNIIKVPKIFSYGNNFIKMERIDDSHPYYNEESSYNLEFIKELEIFYKNFIKYGYLPFDFECYLQKNNQIVILDFDKFIKIYNYKQVEYLGKKYCINDLLQGPFIPKKFKINL
jgi:RIO-like serine/threonine protein kinase